MECLYTNGVSKDAQERLNVFMFIVGESCLPGAEVEGPDICTIKSWPFCLCRISFLRGYDIVLVSRYIFDSKHSKKRKRIVRW